jgi:hypothetical protein
MGTNYYARYGHCPECSRYEEEHIGKSSVGWTFSFHAPFGIKSWKDWQGYLQRDGITIANEYDEPVSFDKFRSIVEDRGEDLSNYSIEYPEGNFLDDEGHSFSYCEFS